MIQVGYGELFFLVQRMATAVLVEISFITMFDVQRLSQVKCMAAFTLVMRSTKCNF